MTAKLAAAALVAAAPSAALAQDLTEIGSVAAANTAIVGTPPALDPRDLVLGSEVVLDERVQTSDLGAGQMLFLDQTTLTVWPNSDVVLDEYVYDPDQDAGEIGLTMTRGLLRFIGGRITKTSEAEIRTPHGVIGVRGGLVAVDVREDRTRVLHVAGRSTTLNGSLVLARGNAVAELRSNEEEPVYLGVADEETLSDFYGVAPGEGDGGGDLGPDADQGTEATGLDQENSQNERSRTDQPVSTDNRADAEEEPVNEQVVAGEVGGEVADNTTNEAIEDAVDNGGFVPLPVPDFGGVRYRTVESDTVDGLSAPAARIAVLGDNAEALTDFLVSEPTSATAGDGRLRVETASGGFFVLPQTPAGDGSDVEHDSDFELTSAEVVSLVELGFPGYAIFESGAGAPPAFELNLFGVPTQPSTWAAVAPPDSSQRSLGVFDASGVDPDGFVSRELDRLEGPFGAAADSAFLLIGAPGARLVQDPALGIGPTAEGPETGKALFAELALSGEGAEQGGYLSVLTSPILPDAAGNPTVTGDLFLIGRPNGLVLDDASFDPDAPDGGVTRLTAPFGFVPGPGGATTFNDPETDQPLFFMLASGGAYLDADPDFDPALATASTWNAGSTTTISRGGDLVDSFGGLDTTAVAVAPLNATDALAADFPSADPAYTAFQTGGYSAVTGFAMTSSPLDTDAAVYLAATDRSGVRLGFAPGRNGVAAEIDNLFTETGPGLDAGRFNFGGLDSRGVLLTGDFHAMRGAENGALTGQRNELNEASGAFDGAMASADLVGAGDLFGGDAPRGAFLSWGWWNGEFESDAVNERMDRFNQGVYVAGVRSELSEVLGQVGTVSYTGDAIAHVLETTATGAVAYLDPGQADMVYNFTEDFGEIELRGILDQTFSGTVSTVTDGDVGNHFTGSVTGATGGGPVRGSFFEGGGDPVAAAAGTATIRGATAPSGNPASAVTVFGVER